MLSLKLQRRVRQEPYESEVPIEGGIADVGVSICTPGGVIIIRVHNGVSVGGARVTVLDLSAPVVSRGGGVGRNYSVGVM